MSLVSVVVPFHAEIDLIGKTVASVFSQDTQAGDVEFEICIGNDGKLGNDAILAAIDYPHRDRVRIASNTYRKGPGGARNTAIDLSSGDILAFLDADDAWLPNKTAAQLEAVRRGASFVAGAYRLGDTDTIIRPPARIAGPIDIFRRRGLGTSTIMARRDLVAALRFRDFRFSQDIDFWYRLAQQPGFSYEGIMDPVAVYSTSGSTRNKLVQAKSFWDVMRHNHVPLVSRLGILFDYAVRGVFNHYLSSGRRPA